MSDALTIIGRSAKVAFLDVGSTTPSLKRMRGFTSLPTSKNPKEYSRQYVDESFERTDVTGINTQVDFAFDQLQGDDVHDKLVDIINGEKILSDAIVTLCFVDMSGEASPFPAFTREFTVIPGTEGDSFVAYTFSGSFKASGPIVEGTATLSADSLTATFTPTTVPSG